MQEGANKLLLLDERDGGGKSKRHVPHHSFAQRLYSKLHSYLASLANLNFCLQSDILQSSTIKCYAITECYTFLR